MIVLLFLLGVVACSRGDTGLRIEEWWEMFKKVRNIVNLLANFLIRLIN